MIPKIFHRIWIGPRRMPIEFERYGETWLKHHPGWEMRHWTEANLSTRYPDLVAECRRPSNATNIYRYEIMLEHGGVYIDTDFECLKNIEKLLQGRTFVACAQLDDVMLYAAIANGFFACVPGHPITRKLVSDIPHAFDAGARSNCGPPFFTDVVRNAWERGPLVLADRAILPRKLFYPYLWTEPERAAGPFPDAYAVHHWGSHTQPFSHKRKISW